MLKDVDKCSDVYLLGCIINFVMIKNFNDFFYLLCLISEKVINLNLEYWYEDVINMLEKFNRLVSIRGDEKYEVMIWDKILN